MAIMVRKQIYLKKSQALKLKRQAHQRGISEAELIRQAIERQIEPVAQSGDSAAWERAKKLMLELYEMGPIPNRPRSWTRDELYEERMSRYARRSN